MDEKPLLNEKFQELKNKLYEAIQNDINPVSHVCEPDCSGSYSYADYFAVRFEDSVELIGGRVFRMSPAPSLTHQRWCGLIFAKLHNYLAEKEAEVFIAPFDVRLPHLSSGDAEIVTVVRPDICVVCDPEKLDERGCVGTPDIVVEVLSSGNNWRELIDKYKVYEDAGVKEYWIVNPKRKHLFVYVLNKKGKFQSAGVNMYTGGSLSTLFPDFNLNPEELLRKQ